MIVQNVHSVSRYTYCSKTFERLWKISNFYVRMWRVMGKGEGITKESPRRPFSHETETLHSIKPLLIILGLSLELELDFRDPFLRWLFGVSTKDKGAPGSLELEEARFASLLWCIGDRRALGHFYDVRQLDCTFAAAVARRIIISDLNKKNVHLVINCYGMDMPCLLEM